MSHESNEGSEKRGCETVDMGATDIERHLYLLGTDIHFNNTITSDIHNQGIVFCV